MTAEGVGPDAAAWRGQNSAVARSSATRVAAKTPSADGPGYGDSWRPIRQSLARSKLGRLVMARVERAQVIDVEITFRKPHGRIDDDFHPSLVDEGLSTGRRFIATNQLLDIPETINLPAPVISVRGQSHVVKTNAVELVLVVHRGLDQLEAEGGEEGTAVYPDRSAGLERLGSRAADEATCERQGCRENRGSKAHQSDRCARTGLALNLVTGGIRFNPVKLP